MIIRNRVTFSTFTPYSYITLAFLIFISYLCGVKTDWMTGDIQLEHSGQPIGILQWNQLNLLATRHYHLVKPT